jgi:hypothetical protein
MAKNLRADDYHAAQVARFLTARVGLEHLRVRRRGPTITIESGPKGDIHPHARLRRVTVQYFQLKMATHTGRWEPTPFRDTLDNVLPMLTDNFGWVLTPVHDPGGTSDPRY